MPVAWDTTTKGPSLIMRLGSSALNSYAEGRTPRFSFMYQWCCNGETFVTCCTTRACTLGFTTAAYFTGQSPDSGRSISEASRTWNPGSALKQIRSQSPFRPAGAAVLKGTTLILCLAPAWTLFTNCLVDVLWHWLTLVGQGFMTWCRHLVQRFPHSCWQRQKNSRNEWGCFPYITFTAPWCQLQAQQNWTQTFSSRPGSCSK